MKHRPFTQFGVAAVGLVVAGIALANTFGRDRREQQSAELEHNRSVGRIQNKLGFASTAFLVEDECTVMTNYHVAFASQNDAAPGAVRIYRGKKGERSTFMIGRFGPGPFDFRVKVGATVAGIGTYAKNDARGRTGDWVIYRLDHCVGNEFGFLKVKKADLDVLAAPNGRLKVISFGQSTMVKPGVAVEVCRARDNGPAWGLVGVDCTFEGGVSGSPVLELQGNGEWLVVGIAAGRENPVSDVLPTYSSDHRNVMVYASAWNQALEEVVRNARAQQAVQPLSESTSLPKTMDPPSR